MLIHRKRNVQQGRGVGSILSTIFRKIAPYAKTLLNTGQRILATKPAQRVLETGKQSLAKAGVQVVDDIFQGKNAKQSVREHLSSALDTVKESALQEAKAQVAQMSKDNNKEVKPNTKKKKKSEPSGRFKRTRKKYTSPGSKKPRLDTFKRVQAKRGTSKADIFNAS